MMVQQKNRKLIVIDPDKCTGCHSCEMACSVLHFNVCGSNYSRIRVQEFREVNTFIPVMCQACEDALCAKVCPVNARKRMPNGAMVTDEDACIGCKACVHSCPFGGVHVNPETHKTMSCDLCNDNELGPWCVKACSMQQALKFVNEEDAARARGREWAKNLKGDYEVPGAKEQEFGYSFGLE
ncbi:MAG: 4Fe-4S dicluster domain-containing protein [Bacteroidetes bacterium]|nr:4Fe-4S dicluster domain-containing protein [Bacteroidota bacterium]